MALSTISQRLITELN